ncbi:MAG: hypothetical protein INR65_09825 [Gluconacetobacter diazotrophicus]|nr:hypothetical protein [Gluconacetobacter diazotrophicus]
MSKTAESITGPVVLDTASIRFGRRAILRLQPAGSAVPFDGGSGIGKVKADLYRILTPADPVLIRGNRLCGSGKPLTFLLVWSQKGISGPVTTLAPSTSPSPPATMDDICGTYSYVPRG